MAIRQIARWSIWVISITLAGAAIGERGTQVRITDVRGDTFDAEVRSVSPSHLGTIFISLTKEPSERLDSIVWDGIDIRYATEHVAEIKVTGEPISFKYERYLNPFHFYLITLIRPSGESEEWYWQGESVVLCEAGELGTETTFSLSIGDIKRILFVHE